jgi:cytochrome d ubiquinol oxidase subunit I
VDTLMLARGQMALSLAFHIVFASVGMAMPVLMVLAEWRWRRTGERAWLDLARAWARGTAVLFAIGAVSGTVLSFELGLLFPRFMDKAGALIGMPFSLEGFAFFLEAIFLGIYLYGWDKVSPRAHLFAGVMVALSGLASAAFVLTVNAWMNAPTGFSLDAAGNLIDVDPLAAMATPFAAHEIIHMSLAAYLATALAAAGIHAQRLRKGAPAQAVHRRALALCLAVAAPAALLMPLSGHQAAEQVARHQPLKLAAMEGQFETTTRAPLRVGGIVDHDARETTWALEIPAGLSILAFGDPDAKVLGLDAFPEADWPSPIVHYAFQVMVGLGSMLALGALVLGVGVWRRRRRGQPGVPGSPRVLGLFVLLAPTGFVAMEAGWVVTEVGRQPWTIQGVLRTADAATTVPVLPWTFALFTAIYLLLAVAVVVVLRRQVRVVESTS